MLQKMSRRLKKKALSELFSFNQSCRRRRKVNAHNTVSLPIKNIFPRYPEEIQRNYSIITKDLGRSY